MFAKLPPAPLCLLVLIYWFGFASHINPAIAVSAKPSVDVLTSKTDALLDGDPFVRTEAIKWFAQRGNKDAIPALIQQLRFAQSENALLLEALVKLSGTDLGGKWFDWMLWQQQHPEIKPFKGYDRFKANLMAQIDPNFRLFLYPNIRHDIRLEEITWGGVRKDGIPALTNPNLLPAAQADYLTNSELVFGVEINGDARAYPLRIMDWHEMFNDVIGGVPVSLAYCTLCGSGILYETHVKGRKQPFIFGSSGFLYRSNKLMYDRETNSLWNQFQGRPVVGKLTGSGIELKTRPVVITSWQKWYKSHPGTKVLSLQTGYQRVYKPGFPYGSYFASPTLMFPADLKDTSLKAKDYVFALRGAATEKAWPLTQFKTKPVINDTAGAIQLTLVGDSATRTVRAFRTNGQQFKIGNNSDQLLLGKAVWHITEEALIGPSGEKLFRLPGHIAYWFAWSGNFGAKSAL